ncbi:hypothetical protein [Merismopedia glauca]|uniref:ACT domain-containing protein n=1 Tax=Merismopedia glauca CCAP 1448/3 TaxID=1296344 RepID=A0A2T1C2G6_9CYAN|nr:hypothetical protein [Merismopedia glauca]PSB02466.1 hypothetical protein C7B64_13045 [Merismopedia glauca CCAP 1448/3]
MLTELKPSTRELLRNFNRSFPQFYEQFVSSEIQLLNLRLAYQLYKNQQAVIEIKPEGNKTAIQFAYRNQSYILSDIFGLLAIYGLTIHSINLHAQIRSSRLVFMHLMVSRHEKPLTLKTTQSLERNIRSALRGNLDVKYLLANRLKLPVEPQRVETQFYIDPVFHLPTLLIDANNNPKLFYQVMHAIWQEDLLVVNANLLLWRGQTRLIFYLLGPDESLIPDYLGQKIAESVRQRLAED